ncbi:MAG: hypothetical protein PHV59_03820 [Victivallales bacterium]|nr:hypothetical protein [Victivallales bacterium]
MAKKITPFKNRKLFSRRKIFAVLLILALFTAAVLYGVLSHKYELFPYPGFRTVYRDIFRDRDHGPWSIGIYEGETPFSMRPAPGAANPVLTGMNCGNAVFVADPFMVIKDGKFYMFFERVSRENNEGDIALAESSDGKNWKYRKVIIDEDFHVSYPYVFEWKSEFYMVIESHQDLAVRLYKAKSFPEEWQFVKKLLSGYSFVDPSIFRYGGKWWLFLSTPACNILNLYYADRLTGEWKSHPQNPLIKFDTRISRPGGRIITYQGKLYRFAQDDEPYYGAGLNAFEITELSTTSYREKPVPPHPLVSGSRTWNMAGIHHIDLHKLGDKWIAAVDGRDIEED